MPNLEALGPMNHEVHRRKVRDLADFKLSCNIVQLSLRGFSEFGAATAIAVARWTSSLKAFLKKIGKKNFEKISMFHKPK